MEEKIIIFDFDGVIVDSFHIAFEVNQLSRPTLTHEQYRSKFNGNIADAIYEDKEIKKIDFFLEYGKRFKNLGIDNNIKNNIIELSKNYKLFIVSSTTSSIIKDYLKKHGLLDSFTEILGFDIETSKVKKFKMIFKKYNVTPTQTIFLSDTSGDINEAKEAKINFIVGMLGGYQDEKTLKKAEPNAIVKNFNDFLKLIKKDKKNRQGAWLVNLAEKCDSIKDLQKHLDEFFNKLKK